MNGANATHWITCSMCGHQFDPSEHAACRACPLQKDCQLVCCPACGFELVNIQKSSLAKWAARWLFPNRAETSQPVASKPEAHNHDVSE